MKGLYDLAMDLCRIRDRFEPVVSGEIMRGHRMPGEYTPTKRKVRLKDAQEICKLNQPQLNSAINQILEHEKLYRDAFEMLRTWVKVLRRGDMGDISPVMDEIFDTEDLLKKLQSQYPGQT